MSPPDVGAALRDRMRSWFDAQDWHYEEFDSALGVYAGGQSGEWPCVAEARADGIIVFSSLVVRPCPPARLPALMRALTRANLGLPAGAFELDLDTGEIRFRTSIDVGSDVASLTDGLVDSVVFQNIVTMDQYLPAIERVVEGEDPDLVVAEVESSPRSGPNPVR